MHLRDGHVVVPVRDGTLGRVGLILDLRQSVSRRQYEGCTLPVEVEARIVRAGGPTSQHGPLRLRIDRHSSQDSAYLEIAVRPSIETVTNTGEEGVVHRRMTERAGDTDALDVPVVAKRGSHTDHGVLAQKFSRPSRTERIVNEKLGQVQPVHVDLEAEAERFQWRDVTLDDLMQPCGVSPELLVAEGVVSEDFPALSLQIGGYSRIWKLSTRR